MAELVVKKFSFKDIASALVREADFHEGIWAVYFEFGLGAGNVMGPDNVLKPIAVVPIVSVGLRRSNQLDDLSVDAAEVNPQRSPKKTSRPPKEKPARRTA